MSLVRVVAPAPFAHWAQSHVNSQCCSCSESQYLRLTKPTPNFDGPYRYAVTDAGGLSDKVTLIVTVNDANDNSPIFEHGLYIATFLENATNNDQLVVLNASDADIGDNAKLSYAVTNDAAIVFKAVLVDGFGGVAIVVKVCDAQPNCI